MPFSALERKKELVMAVLTSFSILATATAARSEALAVEIENRSEQVLCAEKDNVTLALTSSAVRSFRIEAAHPAYIDTLQRDSFEADWTACDMTGDPVFQSGEAKTVRRTLYEEPDFWLVGWTFPTFWRPSTTVVRIGDRRFEGLHLLQLWMIRPMGGEEMLVVYPQDGYWRIRPRAPEGRAPTAFGSSFLVGPVEDAGRPIVDLKEIAFDPASKSFVLSFARGGTGSVTLSSADHNRILLDVTLSKAVQDAPFAMLRSMYVTEFNNDMARVAVREKGAKGWREAPIMAFDRAIATSLWAGRTAVSRHNSSSPDMVFTGFSSTSLPRRD